MLKSKWFLIKYFNIFIVPITEKNMKNNIVMPKLLPVLLASFLTFLGYSQEKEYASNEIILELKKGNYNNPENIFRENMRLVTLADSLKTESLKSIGNQKTKRSFLLRFKNEIDVEAVIQCYAKTNLFEYVEPNYIGHQHGFMQTTPNDTWYSSRQWSLYNNGTFPLSPSTADADIDADLAWDITNGDPDLIVAILDGGIKFDHPEFLGRFVPGYDFVNNDADPTDDNGHGTNVAGIALAKGNNGIGYAGVNWNSKIMVCKITDSNGSGFYSNWVNAMYFAVDNGAKILNMSVGGNGSSTLLRDALDYAYANNVSVVVSSGNQNSSVIQYPARYTNAICVGSTNSNDRRTNPFFWSTTSGSNYGPELDFVAPGNYIYGLSHTSNTNYNTYWGGTSQSSPHVTGVISLLLSVNPALTVDQIRLILQQSSQDLIGDSFDTLGWDQYYGYGRINAYAALLNPLLSNTEYFSESKNLKIYPNPIVDNSFWISGLDADTKYDISIVAMDGKTIRKIADEISNGYLKIDSGSLQSGAYFVQIYNKNKNLTFTKKIVKCD